MTDPTGLAAALTPHRVSKRVLVVAAGFVLALFGGILWGYRYQQAQLKLQAVNDGNAPKMETDRAASFTNELGGKSNTPPKPAQNIPKTIPDLRVPPLPQGFPQGTPAVNVNPNVPAQPSLPAISPAESLRLAAWQREDHALTTAPSDILATQAAFASVAAPQQAPQNSAPVASAKTAEEPPVMKRLPPEGEYIIPSGSWIPAQFGQQVVSDLAGDVTAMTTENLSIVKSGQKVVLIPQKSQLIGSYTSRVAVGQNRLLQVWSKIILPDGSYILLTDFGGADASGASGVKGHVDNHTWKLIRDAAITTAFAVGIAATQKRQSSILTTPSFGDTASMAVGQQLAQIGGAQFAQNFNRQPTISLEPGKEFNAFVNRTIVLDGPYSPMVAK